MHSSPSCSSLAPCTQKQHILIQPLLSIPWCCVMTLIATMTTGMGAALGLWFDHIFHAALPLLIMVHAYGLWTYRKNPHRTKRDWYVVVMSSVLFLGSIAFHASDMHDMFFAQHHHQHTSIHH